MSINLLSTEILQRIYEYATVQDVLHLAQTSKKNYQSYLGRQLHILEQAMHNSYGPLPSLVNLVMSCEPDKSRKPLSTEVRRDALVNRITQTTARPSLTLDVLMKMTHFGKVAERWTEVYPQFRWHFGSVNRRILRAHEKESLRCAIYNYWIYSNLFHDEAYMSWNQRLPCMRTNPDDARLRLIRSFSTMEIIQISEFYAHMLQLLKMELYPSNSIVQKRYSYTLPPHTFAKTAWGEDSQHTSLVNDLLKYDPEDMLFLYDQTFTKAERLDYLHSKGSFFRGSPGTLTVALFRVVMDRCPTDVLYLRSNRNHPYQDSKDEDVEYGIIDLPTWDWTESRDPTFKYRMWR